MIKQIVSISENKGFLFDIDLEFDEFLIRNFYLELGRKNGKALSVNTKIPTPNGYTTMGDLKVGDEVFDKDGNITRVTFATPIMYNHKCYEVTFSDGEKIIADEEHNWLVDRWHKNNFHVETTLYENLFPHMI